MIFKDTIEGTRGLNFPGATTLVLNSNRVGLYKVRASTKSDYYYSLNHLDRREQPGFILSASSVADITAVMDDVLDSNVMVLPVFPDHDSTATPVTKNINYEDFSYAYAYEGDAQLSWVIYYSKGFKKHRVLVDYNLDQLVDIAEGGATTTTTTV